MTSPDLGEPPRSSRLAETVSRLWAWMLESSPEYATYIGEPAEGWTDYSPEACQERRHRRRAFLADLQAIDTNGLDHQDSITHQVAEAYLTAEVGIDAFPHEAFLVDQMNGVHLQVAQTLEYMGDDRDAIAERVQQVPELLDQVVANLRAQTVRPPKVVLADVPRQLGALPFADQIPDTLDRFERFVVDELIPRARDEPGISNVPDGDAWYAAAIEHQTSLSPTPQEVHDLGLAEVDRIWRAMEALAEEAGAGSVEAYRQRLKDDPASTFASAEEQLHAYRALCKEVDATLWRVVTKLPRMPYGVDAMPDYMAESAPTAYYIPGAGGSRRPGSFIVNGHDLPSRPAWRMVPLALHEAVPGHHLQHAIADELDDLPPIRRHLGWNAYVEGWGLYAEHLGEELGFYRTPADRYGRLSFEMWRAARLVVDTGLHALGWSRDRAIAYVEDTTGLGHHDVVSEVDRYISWPGQALGYKLGERVILDLRAEAEAALGASFRADRFHDVLLQSGPVPLPVLEAEVRRWLGEIDAGASASSSR